MRIKRLLRLPPYRLTFGRTIPSERRVWPTVLVSRGRRGSAVKELEGSYAICPN